MTHRPTDRGFTLVEVTVVIAMIGLISAVLAAVFTTVVRTAPASEERLDDASSLLGLTTWLPQDIGSASPTSFITAAESTTSGCASGVDPGSQHLLEVRWAESGTTYVANYRFVPATSATGVIKRFTCVLGGAARANRLTAPLRQIPTTASPAPTEAPAPVNVTRIPLDPSQPSLGYRGVRFEVIVLAADGVTTRSLLTLDAETTNIVSALPPSPTVIGTTTTSSTVPPNLPPVANDLTVEVNADVAVTGVVLPASDPEGAPLAATIESSDPELAVTVAPSGSTLVTVEALSAQGAMTPGEYTFTYRVSDGASPSNTATVTVRVLAGPTTTTTTTSTTTTTTTTTTIPCTAQITSVTPSTVGTRPNDRIDSDVIVRISRNGSCGALVLTFDPDTTDANATPQQLAFNAGTAVTIDKNGYTWKQTGPKPWSFPLSVRAGANGPVLASASLLVTS